MSATKTTDFAGASTPTLPHPIIILPLLQQTATDITSSPPSMSLLVRLKRAIRKVAFLLSFDSTKWLVASGNRTPRISFGGQPGLLDFVSVDGAGGQTPFNDTLSLSRTLSSTWSGISVRSEFSPSPSPSSTCAPSRSSSLDDVDRRAEDFIRMFREHLRREHSLNLPYSRENSVEIGSPG